MAARFIEVTEGYCVNFAMVKLFGKAKCEKGDTAIMAEYYDHNSILWKYGSTEERDARYDYIYAMATREEK